MTAKPCSTARLAEHLRSEYSGEGWEVAHIDVTDRKVYVEVPREILCLSDALSDITCRTGAVADLCLTDQGATLTFWIDTEWTEPEKPQRWWHGIAVAAVAVVATAAAAVVPVVQNRTSPTDGAPGGGGGIWGTWPF